MKVLEILNPQIQDFYNEILLTDSYLLNRQDFLFNDNWKKSFINSSNMV